MCLLNERLLSVLCSQESLRGRPKEIPHNEKLLSLKFEVKPVGPPPQSVLAPSRLWKDSSVKPVK